MNEFKKTITLEVETDVARRNLAKFQSEYNKLLNDILKKQKDKNGFSFIKIDPNDLQDLEKAKQKIKEIQKSLNKNDEFKKVVSQYRKLYDVAGKSPIANLKNLFGTRIEQDLMTASRARASGHKDWAKIAEKDALKTSLAQAGLTAGLKVLEKGAKLVVNGFKKLTSAIGDNVKQMLDFKSGVATFSAGSLITNVSARETKLKYGFSDAQAYAFTQGTSMLGIQSDEDLMYMNAAQRERLLGYMERYSAWYDEMDSSGVLADVQEMQLEFAEFKQEIAMEFLQWVAGNKEEIMTAIRGIFDFVKAIANIVMGIFNLFSKERNYSDVYGSDMTNSNTTNNSRVNNININANTTNTVNGGATNQIQAQQDSMWSDLAKQIVAATE